MHNVHPTPKFSIITITYNVEKVLEDTIRSVISQTYHHIEYIIVDGASKDETLSIIDRYRPHIHTAVSEPDKGLYDAMDKDIALVSGDYFCFLSADNHFHEDDTSQQMVHTINGSELPDILRGKTAIIDKDRHFLRMCRLSAPKMLIWRSFRQGMLVCHQAFFPRYTLVGPHSLQYRFSTDFNRCIRIMEKARTLHNTHLAVIDYLEGGMTARNQKASLKGRLRIMARHYGLIGTMAHHAWFVIRTVTHQQAKAYKASPDLVSLLRPMP